MCEQDCGLWKRPSPRRRCSDGSVSVTLVAEFASLVLQDDILLPRCPAATDKLLLFLHVDKSVHTPSHARIWLLPQQQRACPFLGVGHHRLMSHRNLLGLPGISPSLSWFAGDGIRCKLRRGIDGFAIAQHTCIATNLRYGRSCDK